MKPIKDPLAAELRRLVIRDMLAAELQRLADGQTVACGRCKHGTYVDGNGSAWRCSACGGTGRIAGTLEVDLDALADVLRRHLSETKWVAVERPWDPRAHRTPHGRLEAERQQKLHARLTRERAAAQAMLTLLDPGESTAA